MSVVPTGGPMEHGPVVPHDHHVGLPAVAIHVVLLALVGVQLAEQWPSIGIVHPLDTDDVAEAAEESQLSSFRMGPDDRVHLGGHRFRRWPNRHAAALLLIIVAVEPIGCVATTGRVDRHRTLEPLPEFIGQPGKSSVLVGKQRVTPCWWNDHRSETGAGGGTSLEAPVAVPVLGKQWRRFVGNAFDRDDVLPSLDRGDEGIVTKASEGQREPFQIVVGHCLIRKRQHMVLQPGRSDLGDRVVIERGPEVDAADGGPAGLA